MTLVQTKGNTKKKKKEEKAQTFNKKGTGCNMLELNRGRECRYSHCTKPEKGG